MMESGLILPITLKQNRLNAADIKSIMVHVSTESFF